MNSNLTSSSLSVCLPVDLVGPGDSFSGTASVEACYEVDDHEAGLIVSQSEGNLFKGTLVSKIGDEVRHKTVYGFFYVPNRQLIITPEDYNSKSISLVCGYEADGHGSTQCDILLDSMTRSCGTLELSRDRTGEGSLPESIHPSHHSLMSVRSCIMKCDLILFSEVCECWGHLQWKDQL